MVTILNSEKILWIPNDIILEICIYLNDKASLNILSTTKNLDILKTSINFNSQIWLHNINSIKLRYYDQFTNIIICDTSYKLPKNTKYLTLSYNFNADIENYIPNTVKHLTLESSLYFQIKEKLPKDIIYTFTSTLNILNLCQMINGIGMWPLKYST